MLFYGPAAAQGRAISADGYAPARELADWKARVGAAWPGIALRLANPVADKVDFESRITLEVIAQLNGLQPTDLRIECVLHRDLCSQLTVPVKQYSQHGRDHDGVSHVGEETVFVAQLKPAGAGAGGECSYRLDLAPPWCGGLRYEIRAVPQHRSLTHPYETGLMRWL